MDSIRLLVQQNTPQLITDYHHLHSIPELGFEEVKTAAYVAEQLALLGLPIRTGIAGTGVMATLETGHPGATIMLRADMDALPIQEETGLPFSSTHTGRMHACGHDTHVAMLLATARVLTALKETLCGTILFLFQPAEE